MYKLSGATISIEGFASSSRKKKASTEREVLLAVQVDGLTAGLMVDRSTPPHLP